MRTRVPTSVSLSDRERKRGGWLAKRARLTLSMLVGKLIDVAYEAERRKEPKK